MISSGTMARPWGPISASDATPAVPWLVLAPATAAVAMLPFLQPAGPGNSSPVDVAFAISIGVFALWSGYTGQALRMPFALAVGVMMIGGAVGALAGPLPLNGLLAIAHDFILLVWCAVVVNIARSTHAFHWLLRAWTWSAFAWALLLLAALATGNNGLAGVTDRTGVRASLTFGDPNYAANYFFIALMIVMATRMPRRRSIRIIVYAFLLAALASTGSNGGLLALSVGVAVIVVFYVARRWGTVPLLATLCVGGAIGLLGLVAVQNLPIEQWAKDSGQPLLRDSIGRSSQSAQERAWLVSETIGLYEQGAPWGLGPDSTKPLLQTQLAPYAYQTHDDYIEAIVERGIIGAFGLILLIASVGTRTWAVATKPLAPAFAQLFPSQSPLFGTVAGLAVSAFYYQILHFRHVWTLFAVIAALYLWGRRK